LSGDEITAIQGDYALKNFLNFLIGLLSQYFLSRLQAAEHILTAIGNAQREPTPVQTEVVSLEEAILNLQASDSADFDVIGFGRYRQELPDKLEADGCLHFSSRFVELDSDHDDWTSQRAA
jgi:hypothetical protein